MERNTPTTVNKLKTGDRFYKAKDSKKQVLQMIDHQAKETLHYTYHYWCKTDNDRHPQAIKGDTNVIFLRNATDGAASTATVAPAVHPHTAPGN